MKKLVLGHALSLIALLTACGGKNNAASATTTGTASSANSATSATTLSCAKETCTLSPALAGETLCCKDPFAGGCGIKSGTTCRDLPVVDSRCPVPDVLIGGFGPSASKSYGCCTSANECGVDTGMSMGGSGCQTRTALCQVISKADAANLNPQTCDGTALPLPDNCGTTRGFGPPGGPRGMGAAGSSPAAGSGAGAAAGSGN